MTQHFHYQLKQAPHQLPFLDLLYVTLGCYLQRLWQVRAWGEQSDRHLQAVVMNILLYITWLQEEWVCLKASLNILTMKLIFNADGVKGSFNSNRVEHVSKDDCLLCLFSQTTRHVCPYRYTAKASYLDHVDAASVHVADHCSKLYDGFRLLDSWKIRCQ